jgi:hypothetical protein
MEPKVYFPRHDRAPYLLQIDEITTTTDGEGRATRLSHGTSATAAASAVTGSSSTQRLPRVSSVGRAFVLPTERRSSIGNTAEAIATTVVETAAPGGGGGSTSNNSPQRSLASPPGMSSLLSSDVTAAATISVNHNLYSNVHVNPNSYPKTNNQGTKETEVSSSDKNNMEQTYLTISTGNNNTPRGSSTSPTAYKIGLPSSSSLPSSSIITPDWRLRVRMRTVGVGLVLALNIGTDPPDAVKPHPCAVLQCWMDPRTVSRSKAKEYIGERLEQQYAVWQLALRGSTARNPVRYRRASDPTVDDVRSLCIQLRRQARNE